MDLVIKDFMPKSMEEVEQIKAKLKQCKEEWLETKPGKGKNVYMSHNTVRQILDNAVKGITYWDFRITDRWKEEVYKYDKNTGQHVFDGYVYHVKGYLYIPGVGKREQFGSKKAIGGVDNQEAAYKAAASNCFNKCASLFGVGEEIYSKIILDDEVVENQNMDHNQHQAWNQQAYQQNQQAYQQNQPAYQQNQQTYQQNQQWSQSYNNQQWNNQQSFQNNQTFNQGQQYQGSNVVDQININDPNIDFPFENVPQENNQQAVENNHLAEEKQGAVQNNFEAKEYGAPVGNAQSSTNPWQEKNVIVELQKYAEHKKRLNIDNDDLMIPHLRDFFKDEKADLSYLTPENLKDFNKHLEKISV